MDVRLLPWDVWIDPGEVCVRTVVAVVECRLLMPSEIGQCTNRQCCVWCATVVFQWVQSWMSSSSLRLWVGTVASARLTCRECEVSVLIEQFRGQYVRPHIQ